MTELDVAKIIQKRLAQIAQDLDKHADENISKEHFVSTLRNPWICTIAPDDPGIWRWYNSETGEWGDECNPS